ncbi:FMN-binding negative transcriptional regulator [Roseomonas sp. E05]|nr:FMN-binding negative transcriptional regulator [Roseomonas sp. E05]MDJ0390256.1 FMN-binding negative transcriptional regulator [Roseomonas sp. E05]
MQAARLANLVTATGGGPVATPLPLFLAPDEGPCGTLYGHLARANTQWKLPPGKAMALFTGPDAYVSQPSTRPSWSTRRSCRPGTTWPSMPTDRPSSSRMPTACSTSSPG